MIQYNKQYDLNNGQGWIVFKSSGSGIVSAEYNRGTIQGMWDGETLKGEFIDTVSKGQGLIEFQFNENGFNAKWKAGLDEGPMKGKWVGILMNLNDLDLNDLSKYHIFEKLDYLIQNIISKQDIQEAVKLGSDIKELVLKKPEMHWILYISRLIINRIIERSNEETVEDIISFCDNFDFSDEDSIIDKCFVEVNFNQLSEIDFFYNTSIEVWLNKKGQQTTFIDCISEIWLFEEKANEENDSEAMAFIENCTITTTLANLRNYARSKYDLEPTAYAKLIWTILENNIDLTNSILLKSKYNIDDEGLLLAVDSITFCIEKILGGELSDIFNAENDNSYSSFNGYSNDYIAISEEILGRDIFDE